MKEEDGEIENWRCCTGGMLGTRRVAHAPNGTIVELSHSEQLHLHDKSGVRFTRVPRAVLAWLVVPLADQPAPTENTPVCAKCLRPLDCSDCLLDETSPQVAPRSHVCTPDNPCGCCPVCHR